jgi:signal transduction histidine kinase
MLDRLEEAFAKREASEDRRRSFIADASHELRTPLASIRGYAEVVRRARRATRLAASVRCSGSRTSPPAWSSASRTCAPSRGSIR